MAGLVRDLTIKQVAGWTFVAPSGNNGSIKTGIVSPIVKKIVSRTKR